MKNRQEDVTKKLGERIQMLRTARGMSLRGLADVAGISPSFLSQVEKGDTNVSVGRMIDIANALRVPVESLFGDRNDAGPVVVSRDDRPVLSEENGSDKTLLTRDPSAPMEVYSAVIQPGGATGPDLYIHGDQHEVVIVIRGEVVFQVGRQMVRMVEGDSVEFRSSMPHRILNDSEGVSEVLWVVGTPSGFIEVVGQS